MHPTALWRDIHPIVRAALARVEFVRIHPFSDGNGRMARLLMHALLHEDGILTLPLDAAFTWNRAAYIAHVTRAVQQGDLLGLVQFVLKAIDQAILAGRHMVQILKPHCGESRHIEAGLGLGVVVRRQALDLFDAEDGLARLSQSVAADSAGTVPSWGRRCRRRA